MSHMNSMKSHWDGCGIASSRWSAMVMDVYFLTNYIVTRARSWQTWNDVSGAISLW